MVGMRLAIMEQVRALRSGLVVVVVVPGLMISPMTERMVEQDMVAAVAAAAAAIAIRIVIVRPMLPLI
jgi:predicted regulator of Ras-like GTPase activity (Roadblock/LC7/MglB family)